MKRVKQTLGRYKFSAVLEKEDDMYVSYCAELGIASQGTTVEAAIANLKEAVELYIKHAEPEELKLLESHIHEEPMLATIAVGQES